MNAILYSSLDHKKINGTLFYCFEYFVFLKKFLPNIKYIIMNTDEDDIKFFSSVFKDKYIFDESYLDDIIPIEKCTDFIRLGVENVMTLDIHTYKKMVSFMGKVKTVNAYSNDYHNFVGKRDSHKFYGWYDYQPCNIKTRLKFNKDVHRLYKTRGGKIFLSTPDLDNRMIVKKLGISEDDVYIKRPAEHYKGLFGEIKKIIYFHSGYDTNNRIVVESYLHNIPIEIYYNGYEKDSVKERHELILNGKAQELILSYDDVMIRGFIDDCES